MFSYGGDLYSVDANGGEARRITSHEGNEIFPRLSPDGSRVAFTGQDDGNTEVYLMPVTGGDPERLTYTATNSRDDLGDRMGPNNIVITWTPGGEGVLYRNRTGSGFDGKLWTVADTGGMPERLPLLRGWLRLLFARRQAHGLQQGDARVPQPEVLPRRHGRRHMDL